MDFCYNQSVPTVSSIEPQKKKKDRFNIYVGGKFAFGLAAETLVKSGLKVGQEVSEKEIEKLVFENETSQLLEKALRFLSFRPRSEREVCDYLIKKSQTSFDGVIDKILERLGRLGYVNDVEFAKWWVEQRQTHKPRGARLIRSELYQKGVSREIIDKVLGEAEGYGGEVERAIKAANRKLSSYENLGPRERRQKIVQHLSRRGFGWEVIQEAISSLG